MGTPTVTAVVCAYTWVRWAETQRAVRSLLDGSVAPLEVLLVVDHNADLLRRAQEHFAAPVRVLASTHRTGLSGARNTAVEQARGELVAFLDDDAAADPRWLERLLGWFADPRVAGAGGLAAPRWPADHARPASLPAPAGSPTGELDWVVGCSYTGLPTRAAPIRNLMGCNMVLRAGVIRRAGGFDEALGRVGRIPLGCEETELCIRAHQQDESTRFVFDPTARIEHQVSADRLTWRYLWSRSYAEGVSKAAVTRSVGQDAALASERRYVTATLPAAVLREARRGPAGLSAIGAVGAALAATGAGYLRGRIAVRQARPTPRASGWLAPATES